MVEDIHALTARSGTWQETTEMVQKLNRTLRGWANYFEVGAVTKAYRAITPGRPARPLAGVRLVIPDHALRLPVLRTLCLCTCCRHYPGAAAGRTASLIHSSRVSLPRNPCRVGLRIVLFEVCSAFTRVTACTLALSPMRDTLIEGFSQFVTSMTAPIASGWSGCRVGFAPTGKAPPFHGARDKRTLRRHRECAEFDPSRHYSMRNRCNAA